MHIYLSKELYQWQQPATNDNNIKIISKNCVSFTDFIIKMNNTQIDNAKDIDVVMPVYNLI